MTASGESTPWIRRAVLLPVHLYRRVLSPALPQRCRYHPSCSAYAVEAVERYGILRGGVLAGWRLLRCNPWSHGGYDPPEAQKLFRAPPGTVHTPPSHS